MRRPVTPRQSGFSLLEMMVALAIVGVSLGLLYRVSGGSVRLVGELEMQKKALMLMDSLLDSRDGVPASGWNDAGQTAGLVWRVQSEPWPTPEKDDRQASLHHVFFNVQWSDGGRVHSLSAETVLPELKSPDRVAGGAP